MTHHHRRHVFVKSRNILNVINRRLPPTRFRAATLIVICCIGTVCTACYSSTKTWQRAVREGDEQALRNNLLAIRYDIRTYASKKQELPHSLDDLREGRPFDLKDPITGRSDWQVVIGEDLTLLKGKRGIIDVHSASAAVSSQGTPYNSW